MRCFMVFCLCFVFFQAGSQNSRSFKSATSLIKQGKYDIALDQLQNDLPSVQAEILTTVAQCYFELHDLEEAENYINQALKGKNLSPQTFLWRGRILHHKMKYEEAIDAYKLFLKQDKVSGLIREEVKHLVKQCGHAIKWKFKEQLGYIENLGPKINTKYDEFGPVYSPSFDERIYFSSNRVVSGWDQRSKVPFAPISIYGVEYANNSWSDIFLMNEAFNQDDQNILLDIDRTGQKAMILKYAEQQIVVDTFSNDGKVRQGIFNEHINPQAGDQYFFIINDTMLLFAANKEGGYGGMDIYYMSKTNGIWSEPQNLGPKVNGPYDEICPFLTWNGMTLFFSSNRPASLGGYDVFACKYDSETSSWANGENVFAPVNSPGDDINFRISPSGNSAAFSSNRREGLGGFDLYSLFFKNPVSTMMTEGNSPNYFKFNQAQSDDFINEVDDKPLVDLHLPFLLYGSDDFILTPNNIKKLNNLGQILSENRELLVDIICHTDDSQNPEYDLFFSIKRAEKIKDYFTDLGIKRSRIYLVGAGRSFPVAINQINNVPNPSGQRFNRRIDFFIHDFEQRFNIIHTYPEVVRQFQDTSLYQFNRLRKGLTYKVFVTSSNLPRIPNHIVGYPFLSIENLDDDSGYDYTVGLLNSFFDANLLKKELRKEGLSDVTVYAYINGRRLTDKEISRYIDEFPDLVYYQYRTEE